MNTQKKREWSFIFLLLFTIVLIQVTNASTNTKPVMPPVQADNAAITAISPASANDAAIRRLKAFVDSGVEYAKKYGEKKALAEFSNRQGKFKQGELYLYVYDFQGNCLANGDRISRVGKNFYTEVDPYGTPIIKILIELARVGGGFFTYYWPDVDTREIKIKTSYVRALNKNIAIGAGLHMALEVPKEQVLIKIEEIKAFINVGVEYFKKYGAQTAYKEFNNPSSSYFRRGNLYLFVMDYRGVVFADGANPQNINKNLYDAKDEFGTPYTLLFIQVAKQGGGTVSYYCLDPKTKQTKLRTSHIMPLGNGLLIGSGFYGD